MKDKRIFVFTKNSKLKAFPNLIFLGLRCPFVGLLFPQNCHESKCYVSLNYGNVCGSDLNLQRFGIKLRLYGFWFWSWSGRTIQKTQEAPAREHIALKDKNTLCSEKLTLSRDLWAVCHWFSQLLKQNICLVEIFQKAPNKHRFFGNKLRNDAMHDR